MYIGKILEYNVEDDDEKIQHFSKLLHVRSTQRINDT